MLIRISPEVSSDRALADAPSRASLLIDAFSESEEEDALLLVLLILDRIEANELAVSRSRARASSGSAAAAAAVTGSIAFFTSSTATEEFCSDVS